MEPLAQVSLRNDNLELALKAFDQCLRNLHATASVRPRGAPSPAIRLVLILVSRHVWCGRRDSNPHGLRRWNLNPVRLPIPHARPVRLSPPGRE